MMLRLLVMLLALAALLGTAQAETSTNQVRPKIGLVLGGGGALGFAHIGVLKVLEEARVPIDYIVGTSMGSIIAGLYAGGMSPDEIQSFLQSLDWNEVMSDETPRQELFFRRKSEDQRYLFEMGMSWGRSKMGTGMAAGQKLNNVLQYMALRSVAITNFNDLPIPYRAVATDLESGTAYVIDHGDLAQAMRASMAVPGAFTPARIDGRILVDGGIVNNLPVDVAKAMGADIVIAVDVGSADDIVKAENLNSLGAILGRTYSIAQRPDQIRNYKLADVGIQPPLVGFTASHFDRIAGIAPDGEAAARAKKDALARYAVSPEDYAKFLARQRRPEPGSIPIGEIRVTGNARVSESAIRGRIHTEPGMAFDRKRVYRDLLDIYGIGEFEQVTFRLPPNGDGSSTLVFDTREKEWGPTYFKYGLRLGSDFEKESDWGMLLNLTRMSINELGGEWRNELEIGSVQDFNSEFYQPLDSRGFMFVAPSVDYNSRMQNVYREKDRVAIYDVTRTDIRLDFGLQYRSYAELRMGPFLGTAKADVDTGTTDLPEADEDLGGWNVSLIVDRQDRTVFARQGFYFRADGQFAREEMGGDRDYDKLLVSYLGQTSVGHHTGSLGFRYGSSLDSELPAYAQFTIGGPFGFAGLAEDQFRGSEMAIASAGYRYRLITLPSALGRGVYTITRIDYGNVWEDSRDADASDCRTGVALGLGADTSIGPLLLAYGQAEGGYSRWYFSLGTAF
jgi:NTE family protein